MKLGGNSQHGRIHEFVTRDFAAEDAGIRYKHGDLYCSEELKMFPLLLWGIYFPYRPHLQFHNKVNAFNYRRSETTIEMDLVIPLTRFHPSCYLRILRILALGLLKEPSE